MEILTALTDRIPGDQHREGAKGDLWTTKGTKGHEKRESRDLVP